MFDFLALVGTIIVVAVVVGIIGGAWWLSATSAGVTVMNIFNWLTTYGMQVLFAFVVAVIIAAIIIKIAMWMVGLIGGAVVARQRGWDNSLAFSVIILLIGEAVTAFLQYFEYTAIQGMFEFNPSVDYSATNRWIAVFVVVAQVIITLGLISSMFEEDLAVQRHLEFEREMKEEGIDPADIEEWR